MAKDKEVTQSVDFDGNVVQGIPPAVAKMVLDLKERASANSDQNASEMRMDILERILTADSLEDAAGGTADIMELLNQPFWVSLKAWNASDLGELGVFCVLDLKDDSGREYVVSCGGTNVVAIVYRAENEGRFPLRAQFRSARTKSGYDTLWLDVLPS